MKCSTCNKVLPPFLAALTAVVSFVLSLLLLSHLWLIVGSIQALSAILFFWHKDKNIAPNSLASRIKLSIAASCKVSPKMFYEAWFEQVHVPSGKSIISVVVILLPLFILSHLPNSVFPRFGLSLGALNFQDSNHYQNLIAILAGVGAIIFALIIFIAESLRDDETKDRARVLLRESMLFPLTVAEILVFLNFIWFDVNIWGAVPVVLVAIFTITSLWRLINILLSKVRFYERRLRLLKDRIEQSIDSAIKDRFGDNILLQILGEDKIELSYNPFSLDEEGEMYHLFSANTAGVITDIRIDRLEEFSKIVEKEANRNGFSFYKDKARPSNTILSDQGTVPETSGSTKYTTVHQYLLKKYGDRVEYKDRASYGNPLVFAIDKRSITDLKVLKNLHKLSKEIFVIGTEDTFSEDVNLELAGLKDQFATAIVEKKLGKIEELIKTYISLAESFLDMITRCGGGYDYDQARKERGNILGGQLNIEWLENSIHEILNKAVESRDQEIISKVIFLPMAIAIRAIKYEDQYLYQLFVRFPSRVYWLALKLTGDGDKEIREFMIDRSWRHLKEVTDYYIENQLARKITDTKKLSEFADFSIPVFQAFQTLIKTAFDERDEASFVKFLEQLNVLYRHFIDDHRFDHYDNYAVPTTLPEDERKIREEKIALNKEKYRVSQKILERKQQIVFAVTAFILEKLRQDQQSIQLRRYYDAIKNYLPTEIKELTSLYISARDFDTEHFWDWDGWEVIADGEVHTIDFNSKLDRLYCVKALNLLRGITEANIETIELPHSRDLAFLIEERSGNLFNILTDIESNPNNWSFALDATELSKVALLKSLLQKAKVAQEKTEQERVKVSEVDPDKLAEFKKNFLNAFKEGAIVRSILNEQGAFDDQTSTNNAEIKAFGFNQIDEKAAFIKDWYVHYGGWGENYGRSMAVSETQILFNEMLASIDEQRTITKDDIVSSIEGLISNFSDKEVIIIESLRNIYDEYEGIRRSEAFSQRWDLSKRPKLKYDDNKWCIGYLKIKERYIPVFRIFAQDTNIQNFIILTSVKSFGEMVQYSPIESPDDKSTREGFFDLKVMDLNKDDTARAKIITQNPTWLQEKENGEEYLRERVLINIYEKVAFKVKDKNSASKFFVSDMPNSEDEE